ncbi:hypothetical protein ACTYEO_12760 [Rhodophyticola sp. SM2404]
MAAATGPDKCKGRAKLRGLQLEILAGLFALAGAFTSVFTAAFYAFSSIFYIFRHYHFPQIKPSMNPHAKLES